MRTANRVGSAHCGMLVDNVRQWYEHLKANGVRVTGPPTLRDVGYPWGRYAVYFQDPDGNWLEFAERAPRPEGSTEFLAGSVHARIQVLLFHRRSLCSRTERRTAIPSAHTTPHGRPQGIAPTKPPMRRLAITSVSVVSAPRVPLVGQPVVGASLVASVPTN